MKNVLLSAVTAFTLRENGEKVQISITTNCRTLQSKTYETPRHSTPYIPHSATPYRLASRRTLIAFKRGTERCCDIVLNYNL